MPQNCLEQLDISVYSNIIGPYNAFLTITKQHNVFPTTAIRGPSEYNFKKLAIKINITKPNFKKWAFP